VKRKQSVRTATKPIVRVVFMGLAATFTAAIGLASPFQNGTFDQPAAGSSSALVLDCPGIVLGWTHTNNCGNGAELLSKSGSFGLPTLDGGQYITWGGNGFTGGTLEQTFDTVIGGIYTVDYLIAIQQNTTPGQSMKAEAFDGSTLLGSIAANDFLYPTLTAGPTLHFTAASGSTTLRFTDMTSLANSVPANWGLDTVTVQFTPGATSGVPEPGTWFLATAGLGGLFFWKKKSVRSARS
jgi:hypothetical protein